MDTTTLIGIALGFLVIGVFGYILFNQAKSAAKKENANEKTVQMQLAAYERLALLVDRIALPNLISRVNHAGTTAREMQQLLTQNIKQEFEYNITQQIYVSSDAWNAVKNLKEQNQLVVNQFGNALPAHATGLDLNKLLLEYLMNDKKGTLHEVVSEILSYEAKKLM
jgi:hypothetical protein